MLDFLFNPLLAVEPMLVVILFSLIVLFIINIIQKLLVNQGEAKQVREEVKELSNKMKEEQKQGNTEKANELMKEMMAKNSKVMSMSMKPMLVSFVIIILILPWMSNAYGDKRAVLENNQGEVEIGNTVYTVSTDGSTITINSESCDSGCVKSIDSKNWLISYKEADCILFFCNPERVEFARIVVFLPVALPFFGNDLGWLGWYLFVSIPMAMIIRKALKISL